jgi:hypothetical protein
MYGLHAIPLGIEIENWAGTELAVLLNPIGPSPIRPSWFIVEPAGDVTKTVTDWP